MGLDILLACDSKRALGWLGAMAGGIQDLRYQAGFCSYTRLPCVLMNESESYTAGFGLGALNDADEDDLDVYDGAVGRHGRSRMAYDNALGDDDHHIAVASSSTLRSARRQQSVSRSFYIYS